MNDIARLVADIGGTNARFALSLSETGELVHHRTLATRDFESLEGAVRHFLEDLPIKPDSACIAIACPVNGDRVRMTNHHWAFSAEHLRTALGLQALRVINDFEAVALAVPHLAANEWLQLGPGTPHAPAPVAVIGPGTGLGVAQLIPTPSGWMGFATEGGHAGLAAGNEVEAAVLGFWRTRGVRGSREDILSGPGIVRIYQALAAIEDKPATAGSAGEIARLALDVGDNLALQTLEVFCALLGSVCGDQALVTGARGGVYLAGGILPKIKSVLLNSDFRQRFEDKPPMSHYVEGIPTRLILASEPGLTGAAMAPLVPAF